MHSDFDSHKTRSTSTPVIGPGRLLCDLPRSMGKSCTTILKLTLLVMNGRTTLAAPRPAVGRKEVSRQTEPVDSDDESGSDGDGEGGGADS